MVQRDEPAMPVWRFAKLFNEAISFAAKQVGQLDGPLRNQVHRNLQHLMRANRCKIDLYGSISYP